MEPATPKRLHPALLITLTVGWIALVRLSFAALRYATDLKHAPVFGSYLEEGIRAAGFGLLTLFALRSRMAWYGWLIFIFGSSLLATMVYRPIAASFGREFYRCLNPHVAPTLGSAFYSLAPGLFLMAVFGAGYAYSRRGK